MGWYKFNYRLILVIIVNNYTTKRCLKLNKYLNFFILSRFIWSVCPLISSTKSGTSATVRPHNDWKFYLVLDTGSSCISLNIFALCLWSPTLAEVSFFVPERGGGGGKQINQMLNYIYIQTFLIFKHNW